VSLLKIANDQLQLIALCRMFRARCPYC